ncbi:uncharacterized protein LOC120937844 [Rana temporaria]|uniref:uncharacterized protein LOC120937844 n=1 Tax=Rana temporaria TaxID=8407 RepID=UPI001AAC9D97|nr:uncharacterized protein LOC120937844 [Rana temporaria]
MSLRREQVSGENTQKGASCSKTLNYYCDVCSVQCTSVVQLAEHVQGYKHNRILQSIKPEDENDGRQLGNFLKAHVKTQPIVGMEYVTEVKKDLQYNYSCQLCKVENANLKTIVLHLTESLHNERYIRELLTYLLPSSGYKAGEGMEDAPPSKPESDGKTCKAFEDAPPSKPESDGKTCKAFEDAPPSKPESDGKTCKALEDAPPSKCKSGNCSHSKLSPLPPLAKRSRRSPGGDQDVLPSMAHIPKDGSSHYNKSQAITMDCTATQELEFRTNNEFFGYFANFVISDDKDVVFIRTITQNCIKALKRFLEEEAKRKKTGHQPKASLTDTSRTARETPGILKSHLSDFKTILLEDNSNPPSDFTPKNEATDLFFNSIKNMDESEVVRDFQKLVATNPEFQGMDIPSVIRFLKDSGRLK